MNMNQREIIIQSINHQIETFTEQFLMAAENGGPIPLIEIDLMKHTIRTLYQQLHDLQVASQSPMEPELLTNHQQPIAATSEIEKQLIEDAPSPLIIIEANEEVQEVAAQRQKINILNEFIQETDEELIITSIIEETKITPIVIVEGPHKIAEQVAVAEKIVSLEPILNSPSEKVEILAAIATESSRGYEEPKKVAVNASLFDEFPTTVASKYKEQETLYDKISKNQHSATIAEKLSTKPVIDLRKSIGINERFAFINELFEGNQQLFMESIDKLNNMPVYDDARKVLYEELAGKMKWNTNAKTFSDLDELVKRRFSA